MVTKNKTIWKFILNQIHLTEIEVPKNSELLSCQLQNGQICIWILVDPKVEKEIRRFGLIATGDLMTQEESKFIATIQFEKVFGHFNVVYHLFEF